MVRLSALAVALAGLALLFAPTPATAAAIGPFAPAHSATLLPLVLPPLQGVTNPLCGIFNLIRPWTAGAVLLGMIVAAMGFMLRAIAPEASIQMQNAVKGVGIGLFLVGIALQPAVIGGIAAALGATGLTFTC
jgi:hypothetical protein